MGFDKVALERMCEFLRLRKGKMLVNEVRAALSMLYNAVPMLCTVVWCYGVKCDVCTCRETDIHTG
jgi:hypothetical protein